MEDTFIQWANDYEPLTISEELEIWDTMEGMERLETLLKHNARIVRLIVGRWRSSFDDINDGYSIAYQAIYQAYNNYDPKKYRFGNYIAYNISNRLHRQWKKYAINSSPFVEEKDDAVYSDYSDLSENMETLLSNVLTDKEMQFITNVYYNDMSIGDAGEIYGYKSIQSTSRKHKQILEKLRVNSSDANVLYI